MIINFHIRDQQNVGDAECAASKHFPYPLFHRAETANLMDFAGYSADSDIVLGGGMLLKKVRQNKILDHFTGKKIGWGIGNSQVKKARYNYSGEAFIKGFDLLGVRDYGIGLRYVPCPSCMSPLFDKDYPVLNTCVFYQNTLSAPIKGCSPMIGNDRMNFAQVIAFLASADTVVSSSYHGVYWAMLLGKKVIALPFNAKFYGFKYDVQMATVKDLDLSKIKAAPKYDGYLEECRELNRKFAGEVWELLHG